VKQGLARIDIKNRQELLAASIPYLLSGLRRVGLKLSDEQVRDVYLSAWDVPVRQFALGTEGAGDGRLEPGTPDERSRVVAGGR
jgi:hypothetical protein